MPSAAVTVAFLAAWPVLPFAAGEPQATQPHENAVAFQPGVAINWGRRQVEVAATVILREGPIELLACSPRIREHESIVRIEARPYHVYQALGLIGVTPGHPVRWDETAEKLIPATGEAVEVLIRYQRAGSPVTVSAWDWLAGAAAGPLELRQPWVFAGSLTGEDGSFGADFEGTVVAVVDFPTALLALGELHTSDNAELWLVPNTQNIPPEGTRCTLLLRAASDGATGLVLRMDRFARVTAGPVSPGQGDVRDLVTEYLRSTQQPKVLLIVSPMAARADVERFVARLKAWGVPVECLTVQQDSSSSLLPHDPEALRVLLESEADAHRRLAAGFSQQHELLSAHLQERGQTIRGAVHAGGELLHRLLSRSAAGSQPDSQARAASRPTAAPPAGAGR